MYHAPELAKVAVTNYEYDLSSSGRVLPNVLDALLSCAELRALTGTKQPKRMCTWLETRGWVHEPPARRGELPKVLRAYRDARLSGVQSAREKRADYSFMAAGLA